MAVKVIQENNVFRERRGQNENFEFCARKEFKESSIERKKNTRRKKGQKKRVVEPGKPSLPLNRIAKKGKEYWQCGAKGYFRFVFY